MGSGEDVSGKENQRQRDGILTERAGRPATLSPSNPENEKRIANAYKR